MSGHWQEVGTLSYGDSVTAWCPHFLYLLLCLLFPSFGDALLDKKQNFETIAPYTIEEAYEVADSIRKANDNDLCEELGDLLLQVIMHAQIAKEESRFDFDDEGYNLGINWGKVW